MTGKMRVWPVKSTIRPDIVRWPAVIFSPGVLFCFHKRGIKRLNFSKAKTEKHTCHWNCCLQNVQCLLKKAESVNFPLLKYFFGRKQLIVIRLVSVFSSGPVTCRCRPDITVTVYNMADLHTKYTKNMDVKFYTDNTHYTQL